MNPTRTLLLAFLLLEGLSAAASLSVQITVQQQPICTYANGSLKAEPSGGQAPYTYVWSTGATTQIIGGLLPGSFSVTVTDASLDQATANIEIYAGEYSLGWNTPFPDFYNSDGYGRCSFSATVGFLASTVLPGPPPYYIDGMAMDTTAYQDPVNPGPWIPVLYHVVDNPATGPNTFTFADGNGCTGSYYVHIGPLVEWPTLSVVSIQGACSGTSSGSITIHSTGWNGSSVSAWLDPTPPGFFTISTHNEGTFMLNGLAAGSYTLSQFMCRHPLVNCDGCEDDFNFTIPQLGADCGTVSGSVFIDNDQDCTQGPGEVGVPYAILEFQPGPHYIITDQTGAYSIALVNGSYTVAQGDPALVQLCPATVPAPFTLNYNPEVLDLADSSTVPLDLGVQLGSTAMRPGFTGTYWAHVKNFSPQVSGPVTVTMVIDPALTYDGATPTPTDVTGNTITWQFAPFSAFQHMNFNVNVQVPAGTPLGSIVTSTINVQNGLSDADPTNDTVSLDRTVTGSYDPNDKTGYTDATRSSSQFFLNQDEWIDYTIRFQNTGTDTAFTVVIRDTLDTDLNILSLDILGASHAFTPSFGTGRELIFTFDDINLPDSTTDLLGSQGYVSYRVKARSGLLPGDEITNSAGIYFDFNDPILTNTVTHVVETGTGVASAGPGQVRLMPNPTDGLLYVQLPEGVDRAFSVWSADGRRVAVPFVRTGSTLRLDVHALAPGLYALRIGKGVARFVKH